MASATRQAEKPARRIFPPQKPSQKYLKFHGLEATGRLSDDLVSTQEHGGDDRWTSFADCSAACWSLYTTASIDSSSTATSPDCPGPRTWCISSGKSSPSL